MLDLYVYGLLYLLYFQGLYNDL